MYKVFFNNNTLIISNKKVFNFNIDITFTYTTENKLNEFIFNECAKIKDRKILITYENLDLLWNAFKNQFKIKTAGGGVVSNKNNELLFIKRRGYWDLPKGHQEKGEYIEHTALREVAEECDLENLELNKAICITYHTYWLKGKAILKPTHWYAMNYSGNYIGTPQIEEEITEIKWFNSKEISKALENTFPSIKDVIARFFEVVDA